jgi:hypothetical protein
MRKGWTVLAVVSALCCAPTLAHAQDDMGARLEADAIGFVRPGAYLAGDTLNFLLDKYGDKFLLRFPGNPEIYVLYSDRASVGGRVLKYDTGAVVMTIAGWGGMTLYTDDKPQGLPAVRTGASTPPALSPVTPAEVRRAEADEGQHIAYLDRLRIAVSADISELEKDAQERAEVFDAMENTVRGIDRFCGVPLGRSALVRIDTLHIITTPGRPTANVTGHTLTVTYNRNQGYAGRASSRAIARALGILLHVKLAN